MEHLRRIIRCTLQISATLEVKIQQCKLMAALILVLLVKDMLVTLAFGWQINGSELSMVEIYFQYSLRRAVKMRNNMTSLSRVAGPSYCSISMYVTASVSLIMPSRQKLPVLNMRSSSSQMN